MSYEGPQANFMLQVQQWLPSAVLSWHMYNLALCWMQE